MVRLLENVNFDDYILEFEEKKIDFEYFIGFVRIYFGILFVGDKLYVILLKWLFVWLNVEFKLQEVMVIVLYMFMGWNLEVFNFVFVGVVFGIGGFEGKIFKFGMLCSQFEGVVNFVGVNLVGKLIV